MSGVAFLLAWALGVAGVMSLWPCGRGLRADLALMLPLGLIVGLGATSVVFFAASLGWEQPAWWTLAIEVMAASALTWHAWRRWRDDPGVSLKSTHSWLEWVLGVALVQAVIVAGVIAWRSFQAEPLGGWDGWAIWNMHARFMLRAGSHWPELMSAPQLNWTHPDYPRLVPASVARLWAWQGGEASWVPALVSVAFAGATVALLIGALARLRQRSVAWLGGLVLLTTPFYVTFAANEHADIPLASFMLAAVVMAVLGNDTPRAAGGWALAGIGAGCAAWTKNEGQLFAAVMAGVSGLYFWRTRATEAARSFFVALALALLPVVYFKLRLAPGNDLMLTAAGSRWSQLVDPARHAMIAAALWRDLGRFGEWQFAPWLTLALPLAAWRARVRLRGAERLVFAVLGLMLAGYYSVYLASPLDLAWHLDSSFVRLLLQLWPLAIFGWGLMVPKPRDAEVITSPRPRRFAPRAAFVAVNVAAAIALLATLSTQRAADELAVRRLGFAKASVALGDGWFPLERHARDEWTWSGGRAQLNLHLGGTHVPRRVTLRFALASVGRRTVTIRAGARELWRGEVGEQRVAVVIDALELSPGDTTLEFTTDIAGINETPAAGGRTLAFALYNLRLE